LQTEVYAKRSLTVLRPRSTGDQIEKLVEVRLRRQEILYNEQDDATQLLAVIDEAAIRRAMAMDTDEDGPAQLRHLHKISKRRNVSIRILPLDVGLHAGMLGVFTIFQFSDDIDRDVVHVEAQSGDRYLEEQSSVLEYLRLFDAITNRALDNTESRDLLSRLVDAPHRPKERD
jgi:hypothetical protein